MSSALSEFSGRPGLTTAAVVIGLVVLAAAALGGYRIVDRNSRTDIAIAMTSGDPSAGPRLMRTFGCAGCHAIPGVPGADGKVGPRLDGLRSRVFIAGGLPNTADNLAKWIASPRSFAPHSAMPVTGITKTEARDIVAFLYSR